MQVTTCFRLLGQLRYSLHKLAVNLILLLLRLTRSSSCSPQAHALTHQFINKERVTSLCCGRSGPACAFVNPRSCRIPKVASIRSIHRLLKQQRVGHTHITALHHERVKLTMKCETFDLQTASFLCNHLRDFVAHTFTQQQVSLYHNVS